MHPQLSLHPAATGDLSLDDDLALCRRVGLARTSLSMKKIIAAGPLPAALRRIRDSGVAVTFVIPEPVGFNLAEPQSWPQARDQIGAGLHVAAETGAQALFTTGGSGQGLPFEAAAEAFARAFEPLFAEAKRRGLRVLFEPVRTQFAHLGFVHTFADSVTLSRRHGMQIAFDLTHCWWEPGLHRLLAENHDLIGTLQFADLDFNQPITARVNLGDGQLPIRELLQAALPAGYTGSFDLELIGPAIVAEGYDAAFKRAGAYLERLLPPAP